MKTLILAALIIVTGFSCSKPVDTESNGTIKDMTGLDGCGILIVLDNGTKLEPVKLPQNTVLQPDARVAIEYKPVHAPSVCMAGITVEITGLRYL
jgi:hypothetical protein